MKRRICFLPVLAAVCMPAFSASAENGVFPVKEGIRVEALSEYNLEEPGYTRIIAVSE